MHELLALLSDGTFHSGERLGEVLGVSRSAVWKRLLLHEENTGLRMNTVAHARRLAARMHPYLRQVRAHGIAHRG